MSAATRVLFLGHIASRTGAPIMLLSLLRWLRRHSDIDFDVLLRDGGPLIGEYARVSRVFVVHHGLRWPPLRDATENVRNLFRPEQVYRPERLMTQLASRNIGLIYSNTVANGAASSWLAGLNCPVVCHAHEVETSFQMLGAQARNAITHDARHFVAVTPDIVDRLLACGVEQERITLVPGFVPVAAFASRDRTRRLHFRRRYGIPEDRVLVGACGSMEPRKGPDLFVEIARAALRLRPAQPLHFIWVGGRESDGEFQRLVAVVAHAGLASRMSIHPAIANTTEFFDSLDIFALTSRDDSFPLVAVEAGACERPVVCFAGNAEFVDAQSGVVVPFLDVDAFAEAVHNLASDERRREQLGRQLGQRIQEQHDVSVHAPRIVEIIRSFATNSRPGVSLYPRH